VEKACSMAWMADRGHRASRDPDRPLRLPTTVSEEEARARMRSQLPRPRRSRATVVIDNAGSRRSWGPGSSVSSRGAQGDLMASSRLPQAARAPDGRALWPRGSVTLLAQERHGICGCVRGDASGRARAHRRCRLDAPGLSTAESSRLSQECTDIVHAPNGPRRSGQAHARAGQRGRTRR